MNKPDFVKNQENKSQPKPMFTGMMGTKTPNFINSNNKKSTSFFGGIFGGSKNKKPNTKNMGVTVQQQEAQHQEHGYRQTTRSPTPRTWVLETTLSTTRSPTPRTWVSETTPSITRSPTQEHGWQQHHQ
jgi:hypothetical protein